ncbi:MAG: hypothetical protein K6G62_08920 [Eubacterium sp.]|nr:hypothetical protein [Eubacterium sp.]
MNQKGELLENLAPRDLFRIAMAASKAFPMIVIANLTKNTYTMIRDDGFLAHPLVSAGSYDDMIDSGVEDIHPNYQELFIKSFSRQNLIRSFETGKTDVYAELYQKGYQEEEYHWVSTHVIRIENDEGDYVHVCLNRVLDGINEKRVNSRN